MTLVRTDKILAFLLLAMGLVAAQWTGPVIRIAVLITETGPHAAVGSEYRAAYLLWQDWVHKSGGIEAKKDAVKYGVEFIWVEVGDSAKAQMFSRTANASASAAAGTLAGGPVDMLLCPYSSDLAEVCAQNAGSLVAIAPGASSISVFICDEALRPPCTKPSGRRFPNLFGLLSPAEEYFDALVLLAKIKRASRVASFAEPGIFPLGTCGGVATSSKLYKVNLTSSSTITMPPDPVQLAALIEKWKQENVDFVYGCVYQEACVAMIQQLILSNYLPKGFAFTTCIGDPGILRVGVNNTRFFSGPSQWDVKLEGERYSDPVPVTTGVQIGVPMFPFVIGQKTSAAQFDEAFRAVHQIAPSYQAASALAAVYTIYAAVYQAGTKSYPDVRDAITTLNFPSFYGPISFDSWGRIKKSVVSLQYDQNADLQVLYPLDSASMEMVYPIPSWDYRQCVATTQCGANGECLQDGTCKCSWGGTGVTSCDGPRPYVLAIDRSPPPSVDNIDNNPFFPQPVIRVVWAHDTNSTVTGDDRIIITFSITPTPPSQTGSSAKVGSTTGLALFTDLQFKGIHGVNYTITFTISDSNTSVTSNPIAITPCPSGYYSQDGPHHKQAYDACQYIGGKDCINFTKCVICPEGATCPGGWVVLSRPGWWQNSDVYSAAPRKCLTEDACVGKAITQLDNPCLEGHDPAFPLCAMCLAEWGMDLITGVCQACPSVPIRVLLLILTLILFLFVMGLMTHLSISDAICDMKLLEVAKLQEAKSKIHSFNAEEDILAKVQTRLAVQNSGAPIMDDSSDDSDEDNAYKKMPSKIEKAKPNQNPASSLAAAVFATTTKTAIPTDKLDEATQYVRLFVNYLQVSTTITSVSKVPWPTVARDVSSAEHRTSSFSISFQCLLPVDFYFSLIFYICLPLLCLFIMVCARCWGTFVRNISEYQVNYNFRLKADVLNEIVQDESSEVHKIYKRRSKAAGSRNFLVVACIVLLFLAYTAVIKAIAYALNCSDFGGERLLLYYPSISCDAPEYQKWKIAATVFGLGYGLVLPGSVFALLYRNRDLRVLGDPVFIARYGFLYRGYKLKYAYWEAFILLQKAALVFIGSSTVEAIDALTMMQIIIGFELVLTLILSPYPGHEYRQSIVGSLSNMVKLYAGMMYLGQSALTTSIQYVWVIIVLLSQAVAICVFLWNIRSVLLPLLRSFLAQVKARRIDRSAEVPEADSEMQETGIDWRTGGEKERRSTEEPERSTFAQ
eukprot:TRINITY_DN1987_c0_g1_i1.p1 TRINITY_DN1987_c0_g1~~TRINITY_DN1987_c0_g1_i1.p1  ORF type:complete len:1242 (+),score=217.13 TRINITY_DN1987_c0_g1_i1:60-3785(+)